MGFLEFIEPFVFAILGMCEDIENVDDSCVIVNGCGKTMMVS